MEDFPGRYGRPPKEPQAVEPVVGQADIQGLAAPRVPSSSRARVFFVALLGAVIGVIIGGLLGHSIISVPDKKEAMEAPLGLGLIAWFMAIAIRFIGGLVGMAIGGIVGSIAGAVYAAGRPARQWERE